MAKGKKKLSAKPAKVKPKLTEASAPEQPLRFKALQAPGLPKGPQGLPGGPIGLPEAITNLEARAERPPIAAEDRALLNDRPIIIQTVVQPVPEPVAYTTTTTTTTTDTCRAGCRAACRADRSSGKTQAARIQASETSAQGLSAALSQG